MKSGVMAQAVTSDFILCILFRSRLTQAQPKLSATSVASVAGS